MHRSTGRTNRIARLTSVIATSLLASVALFHAPPAKASLQGATVTITIYEESTQAISGSFNGYVYTFSGAPAITKVTVDPLTHSAFAPTNISFASTSIDVNVSGLHYPSGAEQILDITTAA
jgi:hypothetical protein